jgi:hypothetical protein
MKVKGGLLGMWKGEWGTWEGIRKDSRGANMIKVCYMCVEKYNKIPYFVQLKNFKKKA